MHAVAELAQTRKTGARGLRSMMEGILQPIMFEVPDRQDVTSVVITEDTVRTGADPVYVLEAEEKPSKSARTRAKKKAA